ncbi:MAG: hypothetical protein RhofKO_40990 [Rhodothermales bacterium]
MRGTLPLLGVALLLSACSTPDAGPVSTYASDDRTSFIIDFADDAATRALFADDTIFGSDASVALETVNGEAALRVATVEEFSDAFVDLEALFGHTIDFSDARYLAVRMLVPEGSWIKALKFNFRDAEGNMGGIGEVTNNFYGHYGQWLDVIVDLQTMLPGFENWVGETSPLPNVKELSFNPYNGHQADSSVYYISRLQLSNAPITGTYHDRLAERPIVEPNIPYTITFDDPEVLHQQMAIRGFESTYQALQSGVAGNETMAIRVKGRPDKQYIAFLPMIDKLTGQPADFRNVERISFDYYLTEDSAPFDGSSFFIVTEHWQNILLTRDFYDDYKRGAWHTVSVNLADIDFDQVSGTDPVLPNVYELRLDLNYESDEKGIEMWIDNFRWE